MAGEGKKIEAYYTMNADGQKHAAAIKTHLEEYYKEIMDNPKLEDQKKKMDESGFLEKIDVRVNLPFLIWQAARAIDNQEQFTGYWAMMEYILTKPDFQNEQERVHALFVNHYSTPEIQHSQRQEQQQKTT